MWLIAKIDIKLGRLAHDLPARWRPTMIALSFCGYQLLPVVLLVSAISAIFNNQPRVVLAIGIAGFASLLSLIIKHFVHRPRPDAIRLQTWRINTYSFPSGHSAGSSICYGLLAYLAITRLPGGPGWLVAASLVCFILLIGLSRVYLRVHYPSDVLGGWLFGLISLVLIINFAAI